MGNMTFPFFDIQDKSEKIILNEFKPISFE